MYREKREMVYRQCIERKEKWCIGNVSSSNYLNLCILIKNDAENQAKIAGVAEKIFLRVYFILFWAGFFVHKNQFSIYFRCFQARKISTIFCALLTLKISIFKHTFQNILSILKKIKVVAISYGCNECISFRINK